MTQTPTEQRPQEWYCKNCAYWSEQGAWYVSGILHPYGRCERQFQIYKKNPCGQDIDRLARMTDFEYCHNFTPKTEKQ